MADVTVAGVRLPGEVTQWSNCVDKHFILTFESIDWQSKNSPLLAAFGNGLEFAWNPGTAGKIKDPAGAGETRAA